MSLVCLLNRLSIDYLGRNIHRKARAKARHSYKYRNHSSDSGGTSRNPTNRLGPLTYPFSFFRDDVASKVRTSYDRKDGICTEVPTPQYLDKLDKLDSLQAFSLG